MNPFLHYIGVKLTEAQLCYIEAQAERVGGTKSQVVRCLIDAALREGRSFQFTGVDAPEEAEAGVS